MTIQILLVDDHPLICDGIRYVLSHYHEPVNVVTTHDCSSALKLAAERSDLDLVLLDINLGSGSGLDCLPLMLQAHPRLPVIILSATEEPESVRSALKCGARGYIPKSSATEVMLSAIRLVLEGGIYVPRQALNRDTGSDSNPFRTGSELLTPRQIDVLRLLAKGYSNKLIARELSMSDGTVRVHITSILRALRVANRTQAGIVASRLGLNKPAAVATTI